jgi:hypothetical protein
MEYKYIYSHQYRLVFIHPVDGSLTYFRDWQAYAPDLMPQDVADAQAELSVVHPGTLGIVQWLNPATGHWENITDKAKYALFSPD